MHSTEPEGSVQFSQQPATFRRHDSVVRGTLRRMWSEINCLNYIDFRFGFKSLVSIRNVMLELNG
jgi:hypothetical protein